MAQQTTSQRKFLESEEAARIRESLLHMQTDSSFNTRPSYTANGVVYPDNHMTFAEKHMHYLSEHQDVNAQHYLSNLRLMTRVKQK
jgi:hypothetical protein